MEVISCKNCGGTTLGKFCANCGQRTYDHTNRSIKNLLTEFFGNLFFFDNRFWLSIRYLIRYPGTMSKEYLAGKRRKFLAPISIFLFSNLAYFLVNPLTDYSLPLHDQMNSQPYSVFAKEMVETKLGKEQLELSVYARDYNQASLNISKSVMILNVPIVAVFVFLISLRRTKFYYDSLIFSLHYFSLFLLMLVVGAAFFKIFGMFITWSYLGMVTIVTNVLLVPFIFASISIRNYLSYSWLSSVLGGLGILFALGLSQFIYRPIIFLLTFYST